MSFAGITYQTEDRDARALARKIEPLAKFFHDAEMQVRTMSAPPSLSRTHEQYVDAMALYANAAAEMLKFTEDGDSQHLDEAHRMDVRASEDMLRVGEVLWPGQYKPHYERQSDRTEKEDKRSPISIRDKLNRDFSQLREEGNEKTRITNSSVRVDRGDSGAGMPVQRGGAGPATDLLGLADREQPFHERAVRLVHAGPRIRARQHQAGEQHSDASICR